MSTLFEKIIDRKVPADILLEEDRLIVIRDIAPIAPLHLLIIPKTPYPDIQSIPHDELSILSHIGAVAQSLAKQHALSEGYRLVTNCGAHAGQEVFHLHFHLIGGAQLGPIG
ncbi:MAG: HIT domain-containing protein [Chlamydiota bacterium]|nr:HIT domain-containing protein [Chlamydiota bacterium]